MRPIRQGHPDRVNHDTLYPVGKGVRDSLSHAVERAVDERAGALAAGNGWYHGTHGNVTPWDSQAPVVG